MVCARCCSERTSQLALASCSARNSRSSLRARGAKYLAMGVANAAYEAGLKQRMVIIEWPNLQAAIDAHDCAEYQAALKVFNNAAERDFRILEAPE